MGNWTKRYRERQIFEVWQAHPRMILARVSSRGYSRIEGRPTLNNDTQILVGQARVVNQLADQVCIRSIKKSKINLY